MIPRHPGNRADHGNPERYPSHTHSPDRCWAVSPVLLIVVARGGSVLSSTVTRGGRDRFAIGVLAGYRVGLRDFVSLGRCRGTAALSGLFLSRRADHDCALYFDLHHDVGD